MCRKMYRKDQRVALLHKTIDIGRIYVTQFLKKYLGIGSGTIRYHDHQNMTMKKQFRDFLAEPILGTGSNTGDEV